MTDERRLRVRRRLLALGVDGIITDYPDRGAAVLRESQTEEECA